MLAQVCAVIVNVISSMFKSKYGRQRTINPSDFIPKWHEIDEKKDEADDEQSPPKEQTVDDQKSFLKALAQKFGIKMKRREVKK